MLTRLAVILFLLWLPVIQGGGVSNYILKTLLDNNKINVDLTDYSYDASNYDDDGDCDNECCGDTPPHPPPQLKYY